MDTSKRKRKREREREREGGRREGESYVVSVSTSLTANHVCS